MPNLPKPSKPVDLVEQVNAQMRVDDAKRKAKAAREAEQAQAVQESYVGAPQDYAKDAPTEGPGQMNPRIKDGNVTYDAGGGVPIKPENFTKFVQGFNNQPDPTPTPAPDTRKYADGGNVAPMNDKEHFINMYRKHMAGRGNRSPDSSVQQSLKQALNPTPQSKPTRTTGGNY